jgi:MoaA/NifB/PqqE/SkfB family radical SAM enzyme
MQALTHIQIEPTTRCNFTCSFCCGRYMEQSDIDFARYEQILAAAPDLQHIELQGEGESLMHPRFFDMVRLARERGARVSLISNGSYLTPTAIEQILDVGIEKISVSLESADPVTFRHLRGGKLDKVVRGIEGLMEARRARGLGKPVVGFAITVLRDTQDHLAGILELYKKLGLDGGVTLQPLQSMPVYVQNYPLALSRQLLSDGEVNDLWIQFYAHPEIKRIQRAKKRTRVLGFFDELMVPFKAGERRCPWLESGLYVNNQGIATGCCMIKDTAQYALGRFGVDPPEELLSRREALQKELRDGQIPKPCAGCELARFAVMTRFELLMFALRGLWRRWSPRATWRRLAAPKQKPRISLPLAQ